MTAFPPRAQLVRVVISLAKHLPEDLGSLLEAGRFDAERTAVSRLADPAYAWAAARSMEESEASWLSGVLLERWAEVANVNLEPFAAIVARERVWLSRGAIAARGVGGDVQVNSPHNTAKVRFEVAVDGLDDGFAVRWSGPRLDEDVETGAVVECELCLEDGSVPADVYARVTVEGRHSGKRILLVDEAKVRVSMPVFIISDDRKQFVFQDHLERRAVNVDVRVGSVDGRTDRAGTLHLEEPAEPGAQVYIEGTPAGRIPGARAPIK